MSSRSKKYIIYLVPHTHYDAVWVFTKEDYFYINIELILKKAVELIEKGNYRFLNEQSFLLEETKRRNPHLFSKIKKFIRNGKIEIADGEYLMADTMLPGGETLIREILFGKKYLKDEFKIEVPVMWGADSFGYNAQLPQIYKKSGYKFFAFRRGADKNKPSEFWWEGLDGTKILSHWMPLGYRAGLDLTKLEESFEKLKNVAATSHILMPSGSGVTLPQSETSEVVRRWNKTHRDVKIKIAQSSDFFKKIEKEAKNLRIFQGELYSGKYSEVFPNCASSRIWLKQNLRRYENLILTCEKWATIAWLLGNYYPFDEFKENWKKILFGAFHDVAPGTGMDECYQEARYNFKFLETHLNQILTNALLTVAQNLKNKGDIIVFNSLSWDVKNWVEVKLNFNQGEIKKIRGVKNEKEESEIEILESSRYPDNSYQTIKIGFIAKVPALGYQVYKILQRKPRIHPEPKLTITGNTIRNQFFKTKINPSTGLISIFQNGKLLAKGNELVLEEEIGDLYYHRQNLEQPLKTEGGEGIKYGFFKMNSFRIRKNLPRIAIEIKSDYYSLRWPYRLLKKLKPLLWRHKYISILKKIIIYKELPRIDFITIIKNQHPQIRMRLKFASNINSFQYNSETQFGVISRPTNQYYINSRKGWLEKPCGIFPALNWVDYSDKEKGVTLINKGLPAHEIRDGNIYLTLLRSILMLSSDGISGPAIPVPDAREFKTYSFDYSLFPHPKDWKAAESFKTAHEFKEDLVGLQMTKGEHKKNLPSDLSFIEIKPNHLILSALKKAESKKGIILRLFETKGEKTRGEINLFKKPKSVRVVNLIEEENISAKMKLNNKKIRLNVKPFEIITLKIYF